MVLARPSPILFYPISSTEVRCLIPGPVWHWSSAARLSYLLLCMAVALFCAAVCVSAVYLSCLAPKLCAGVLAGEQLSGCPRAWQLTASANIQSCPLLSCLTLCLPVVQVRCLVDVQGETLPSASTGALQAHLESVVAPQVPEQLRASFLRAAASGEARSMQNKSMPAAPLHCPGALLLGDSFNMRHPLTGAGLKLQACSDLGFGRSCSLLVQGQSLCRGAGTCTVHADDIQCAASEVGKHFCLTCGSAAGGGMTVALGDAALLCSMLQPLPDLDDSRATAAATAAFYSKRTPLSSTINTLANALYQVHCSSIL